MTTVPAFNRCLGTDACLVVAEIGINHNGSLQMALELIDEAHRAGADAVKFQKRTVELCYTPEELARPRHSPWGTTTEAQKRGIEFGARDYDMINEHCRKRGMPWFASCWDTESVSFIEKYHPPAHKVASKLVTNHDVLHAIADTGRPVLMSVGGAKHEDIEAALDIFDRGKVVLLHCIPRYPAPPETLNLVAIDELRARYGVPVGYSGHEVGLATSIAAVCHGACVVERHFTLDRSMWGSDQAASVEPQGLTRLVRDIRNYEIARGHGGLYG